ncbi:unnamed protein product [Rhizophagus irregularis]|uniref:Helicase C-terminal domain-containing protein n=1 Tax=Rhizophagus irregularis TaxID=588596 RepID=A0A915ZME4_9GLOM|nr:unnamed protein product [Rhizophagus irregularis]
MITTNAFKMGLNDKKVQLVIHYAFPLSIGNLVQETGRAGRNHNPANHNLSIVTITPILKSLILKRTVYNHSYIKNILNNLASNNRTKMYHSLLESSH